MNRFPQNGYRKKSRPELIKAIQDCTSLSQLFALIQLEGITIQMHAQSGASNLKPRVLSPKDIVAGNDTPLERLKAEVLKAIGYTPPKRSYEDKRRILNAIDSCKTLHELFALIEREKIVIRMHTQSSASNLWNRELSHKEITDKDNPFERLKMEVRKSVVEN